MTAMLVSVAELSNIFSVLAVLICFCGVFLFIMRYACACAERARGPLLPHPVATLSGISMYVRPFAATTTTTAI